MLRRPRAVAILVSITATVLATGCPSHGPVTGEPLHPGAADDIALRTKIAHAEVTRAAGVAELVELVHTGDAHARALALRGLGRIGGDAALAAIDAALVGERDPDVLAAALGARGIAAALDEAAEPDNEARDAAGAKLVAALPACGQVAVCAQVGVEAIGRAGGPAQLSALVGALGDPRTASAAAIALGRYGRRKISLDAAAEQALIAAAASADRDVRYAATYALARAVIPPPPPPPAADASPVVARFAALLADKDPDIRALAITGLAKHKAVASVERELEALLADDDWRVAVEAIRALAGDSGTDRGREAVVEQLAPRLLFAASAEAGNGQVITEALRTLAAHPATSRAAIADLDRVIDGLARVGGLAPRTIGWISALALYAREMAEHTHRFDVYNVDRDKLPDNYIFGLAAELAAGQDLATRRMFLRDALASRDVRVRAAALPVLASTWQGGDADDRRAIVATFIAALGSTEIVLASEATDAAGALYDAIGDAPERAADRRPLDAAVIARAEAERDPELAGALVELIGKHKLAAGASACRLGLGGHPVVARAAADCLKALGESGFQPPAIDRGAPPPVDVTRVIGKRVTWLLKTSRGDIAIELRPDVAPWNVAAIVALTEHGFYDHLDFHRVVPDFVVQGGDPTMSGDGGPGYTTPAEPATLADGPGFVAGGIGMADAGRDSAGSQWFAMHSRAPHLDGRYTWVGAIVSGQAVVDQLLIGDRVETATVKISQ